MQMKYHVVLAGRNKYLTVYCHVVGTIWQTQCISTVQLVIPQIVTYLSNLQNQCMAINLASPKQYLTVLFASLPPSHQIKHSCGVWGQYFRVNTNVRHKCTCSQLNYSCQLPFETEFYFCPALHTPLTIYFNHYISSMKL